MGVAAGWRIEQGRPFYPAVLKQIKLYIRNDLRRLDIAPGPRLSVRLDDKRLRARGCPAASLLSAPQPLLPSLCRHPSARTGAGQLEARALFVLCPRRAAGEY